MANIPSSGTMPPVTQEAFLADRQRMFAGFGHATLGAVIFMVVLLVLMALFLV